ncbi:hypothetical protein DRW41_14360 [Neobacillus piezotolerans]|uniref:Uncharacterized protein n=1 Tax=Neobacillus piezotolerans TaxID=2259171 RepID=A0A3D8GP62_9BACI|nr:hypothetical protein [Neobacillus piezotolerans]RDU36208.1 hypothetical protein DRW41_14360 [Neobacillus piezotolerans]
MAKNRYMLCFLLAIFLIYYAGPRLPFEFGGAGGIFTASWTVLALLVLGGNLAGTIRAKEAAGPRPARMPGQKKRMRSRY